MLKRNVLHLIGSFQQGGSERQALQLARLMRGSESYRAHVACLDRRGVLFGEAAQFFDEIPEFPLNSFYDRNMIVQLRRFAGYLRQREIAVVHTHDFYTNVFGITGAALAGVPARIGARRETFGFRSEMQKRVERSVYRLTHAVIANADAVKEQLIKEGVRAGKITTVYNGLDLERTATPPGLRRADALARFDLPQDEERLFVTIVANLHHPVKDHPTFLRAARLVREAVPEAAFVIAGEGELTAAMRALAAELGLEQDAFFTGRCQNVAELLFASDVCVLSSKAEGFSNSILEYMAARRPVVATDVGGAREAIIEGETGYLVSPGDDEGLAARIISLLRGPELRRAMGERGRRRVEENFSSEAQLRRTENLYERLLAGKKRQAPLPQRIEGVSREGA